VYLSAASSGGIEDPVRTYLNRLSDFFFAAARWANHIEGYDEESHSSDQEVHFPLDENMGNVIRVSMVPSEGKHSHGSGGGDVLRQKGKNLALPLLARRSSLVQKRADCDVASHTETEGSEDNTTRGQVVARYFGQLDGACLRVGVGCLVVGVGVGFIMAKTIAFIGHRTKK
jgi:hypothetical protein